MPTLIYTGMRYELAEAQCRVIYNIKEFLVEAQLKQWQDDVDKFIAGKTLTQLLELGAEGIFDQATMKEQPKKAQQQARDIQKKQLATAVKISELMKQPKKVKDLGRRAEKLEQKMLNTASKVDEREKRIVKKCLSEMEEIEQMLSEIKKL